MEDVKTETTSPPCAEIVPKEETFIVAGRHWSSTNVRRLVCINGMNIKQILLFALREELGNTPTESQERIWLERCRCRVNGVEIERFGWEELVPDVGAQVEFLVAPLGGGGGGKGILRPVMMIAVMIASIYTGGLAASMFFAAEQALVGAAFATGGLAAVGSLGAATIAGAAAGWAIGAATSMAVMMAGSWAVNKVCPTQASPQARISESSAKDSPTYSLNGGQNSPNTYGYVPLVLGRYRITPPLGARSWTEQVGDDQYFNMLVVWGYGNTAIEDIRIGDTPLYNYYGVTHIFHGNSTGNDLVYFNRSYKEQAIGADLKCNIPVLRVIGECDSISVDVYLPSLASVGGSSKESTSVSFKIEYAHVNQEDWRAITTSSDFYAPAQYIDHYTGSSWNDLWATRDGAWHGYTTAYGVHEGDIRIDDPRWDPSPLERYKDKHKHHEWWTRDSWFRGGVSDIITVSGAKITPTTKSYQWAVPHGEYRVRITRITPDSTSDTVYNDTKWSTARAIVNKPAFNTPIPISCSEIRIKANEQLSGYVSNLNALAGLLIPVFQPATGSWLNANGEEVYGYTSNPADHIRHLLTSRQGLNTPYSHSKIDQQSLARFADFCLRKDFHFDFVADSESAAWARLSTIASAGRGAITTDNDGLFGVMIDNNEKVVSQMFTPRNSWGFSMERNFYTMPHALRVAYHDETDGYQEKEGFIYADGYNQYNATDIVEWNFTGKTRWWDIWRMGRYYLASIKLRPVTITLSTDWEWLMCRRGDIVGVSHDVLMNTFGTARIIALIYRNADGSLYYISDESAKPSNVMPIGVKIDDEIHFSERSNYGIAIRTATGTILTYQINYIFDDVSSELIFSNGITAAQVPYIGALCSVSTFGQEYEEYLLVSVSLGNDNAAELTLVPYAMPEIFNSEWAPVPAWQPPIKLDTIGSQRIPEPSYRDIRSDESVLLLSGNSIVSQIAVWYNLPNQIPDNVKRVFVQLRAKETGEEDKVFDAMVETIVSPYVAVQGVEDGKTYDLYIRLVSDTGMTSEWVHQQHTVIGKTSPPPDIKNFTLEIDNPQGVKASWTEIEDLLDFSHYQLSGYETAKSFASPYYIKPFNTVGTITESVQGVDTGGRASVTAASASVTIRKPRSLTYEETRSIQQQSSVGIAWASCMTDWDIDHYTVFDVFKQETSEVKDASFSMSPRAVGRTYDIEVFATDIFGNAGDTFVIPVGIGQLEMNKPSARIDGADIVLEWRDANSPFTVDYYTVYDISNGVQKIADVKATVFRMPAPEYGARIDEYTKSYRVSVTDVAGNVSSTKNDVPAECSITVRRPTPPAVTATKEDDHIRISWTITDNVLPIVSYDIVRWHDSDGDGAFEEEDYGTHDSMTITVPAVSLGTHYFEVRATDSAGNVSGWGEAEFVVTAPGAVHFYNCSAIDNNVMIYYTQPTTVFFPIAYYLAEEIEGEYSAIIGRVDALFFSDMKDKAGRYTYGVTPVDVAGNRGERQEISIQVSQPPDFVMYDDKNSLFNGTMTNMYLDRFGNMIGPVSPDETWQGNIDRIGNQDITWQGKIDGGNDFYWSPTTGACSYVETVDIGTVVPSTKITVIVTSRQLDGELAFTCKIETSMDSTLWTTMTENGTSVYATKFRYVRYTLTWTGSGAVAVSNINYKLDVKRMTDFGRVLCAANDNGDGWISETATPMLTGTWIPFNTQFTDVQSFPRPTVSSVTNVSGDLSQYTAYVVFEDVLNPQGFRCFVKDKNGNRVSATVDWVCYGV